MKDNETEVRPVRALHLEGSADVHALVHCPDRGETRDLEACLTCERFSCLQVDGARRTLVMRCHRLAAEAATVRPPPAPLGELMAAVSMCLRPETHLDEIRRLFQERGISGAAVVDERGRPVGMVTKTDLLEPRRGPHARDVMMPFVFSLPETAPVAQAAALMAAEGIHQVPVVAPDGALLGMVTSLDVMRWLARREGWLAQTVRE